MVISCYFNPNDNIEEFKQQLQNFNNFILLYKNEYILLAGDFNANLILWGSNRNNKRGYVLLDTMSILDMRLVNQGNVPTCVRVQGSSVVDLTWTSFSLIPYVTQWRVLDNIDDDSLSDHRFIRFDIKDFNDRIDTRSEKCNNKRWNMNRFNIDIFLAFIEGVLWLNVSNNNNDGIYSINEESFKIIKLVRQACDAAAPHVKKRNNRNVYWWNPTINEKRKILIKFKRRLLRLAKRSNVSEDKLISTRRQYKLSRLSFKREISSAKIKAWNELIADLDKDPWGRAYRIVINKLKPYMSPVVSNLPYEQTRSIIDELFPKNNSNNIC